MVDTLIKRYQTDPVMHEVVSEEVTVEEMQHRFLSVHDMDKVKVAAAIVRGVPTARIVFVRTKRAADRVASDLRREGVEAASIHGDLRQSHREKALKDFSRRQAPRSRSPPTSPPVASTSTTSTW